MDCHSRELQIVGSWRSSSRNRQQGNPVRGDLDDRTSLAQRSAKPQCAPHIIWRNACFKEGPLRMQKAYIIVNATLGLRDRDSK